MEPVRRPGQRSASSFLRLIQTTDPVRYRPLFDITSRASAAFCARQGIAFEPFIGIKRGQHAWHATFNRIALLAELCDRGCRDRVIYLDADAYPFDIGFDVRAYFAANSRYGLIGARGGEASWNVNAGILLFDLGMARVRALIAAWQAAFDRLMPDSRLASLDTWPEGGPDDQTMLHGVLAADPGMLALLKIESFGLIGWPGSTFIRQLLRTEGSLEERCRKAQTGVAEALG